MSQLQKILKDNDNNAQGLDQLQVGETYDNSVSTIGALVAYDPDGKAIPLKVNSEGSLVVSFDSGTTVRGSAILAEGSQTKDLEVEALVIDLTITKDYNKVSAQVACFRTSKFRMVYVDDYGVTDTETELGYALCDAGNINEKMSLVVDSFTTVGGTGVQKLVIYHTPTDKVSDAFVSASVNEIA